MSGSPARAAVSEPASLDERRASARPRRRRRRRGLDLAVRVSILTVGLVALVHGLVAAKPFLMPLVAGALLGTILSPVARVFRRHLHLPRGAAAALVMTLLLGALSFSASQVIDPARSWIDDAPSYLQRIERRVRELRRSVVPMSRATEQVEKIAELATGGDGRPASTAVVKKQGMASAVLQSAGSLVGGLIVTLVTCFFLLATDEGLFRSLVRLLPDFSVRRRAVQALRRLRLALPRYLFAISLINLVLALVTALACHLLGMPNPLLWGAVVGLFNFAPYIGPLAAAILLGLVALAEIPNLGQAALVPLAALALSAFEGQIVTPVIVGRRLTLRPLVVFVAIIAWYAVWGVPGALLAVPLLVVLKSVLAEFRVLRVFAEVLGRPESLAARA